MKEGGWSLGGRELMVRSLGWGGRRGGKGVGRWESAWVFRPEGFQGGGGRGPRERSQ